MQDVQAAAVAPATELTGGTQPGFGGGGGMAGPFQRQFLLTLAAGQQDVTATFNVPATQVLVIETVTADLGVDAGNEAFLFVTTTAGGVEAMHTIDVAQSPAMPTNFRGTHQVRLYADPGATVTITVSRAGTAAFGDIPKPQLVTISGRTQL